MTINIRFISSIIAKLWLKDLRIYLLAYICYAVRTLSRLSSRSIIKSIIDYFCTFKYVQKKIKDIYNKKYKKIYYK